MEIKDALYQAISEYEEKRILSDIAQGESSEAISAIFNHCVKNVDGIDQDVSAVKGAIAEGLTHYMLTVALIPSQRKTAYGSVEIDVAVPNTRSLAETPEDVIVIHFPKTDSTAKISEQVGRLKKVQPRPENIWVVVDKPVQIDAKVYALDDKHFSFANIINDLISFSSGKKQSKLKIFRI